MTGLNRHRIRGFYEGVKPALRFSTPLSSNSDVYGYCSSGYRGQGQRSCPLGLNMSFDISDKKPSKAQIDNASDSSSEHEYGDVDEEGTPSSGSDGDKAVVSVWYGYGDGEKCSQNDQKSNPGPIVYADEMRSIAGGMFNPSSVQQFDMTKATCESMETPGGPQQSLLDSPSGDEGTEWLSSDGSCQIPEPDHGEDAETLGGESGLTCDDRIHYERANLILQRQLKRLRSVLRDILCENTNLVREKTALAANCSRLQALVIEYRKSEYRIGDSSGIYPSVESSQASGSRCAVPKKQSSPGVNVNDDIQPDYRNYNNAQHTPDFIHKYKMVMPPIQTSLLTRTAGSELNLNRPDITPRSSTRKRRESRRLNLSDIRQTGIHSARYGPGHETRSPESVSDWSTPFNYSQGHAPVLNKSLMLPTRSTALNFCTSNCSTSPSNRYKDDFIFKSQAYASFSGPCSEPVSRMARRKSPRVSSAPRHLHAQFSSSVGDKHKADWHTSLSELGAASGPPMSARNTDLDICPKLPSMSDRNAHRSGGLADAARSSVCPRPQPPVARHSPLLSPEFRSIDWARANTAVAGAASVNSSIPCNFQEPPRTGLPLLHGIFSESPKATSTLGEVHLLHTSELDNSAAGWRRADRNGTAKAAAVGSQINGVFNPKPLASPYRQPIRRYSNGTVGLPLFGQGFFDTKNRQNSHDYIGLSQSNSHDATAMLSVSARSSRLSTEFQTGREKGPANCPLHLNFNRSSDSDLAISSIRSNTIPKSNSVDFRAQTYIEQLSPRENNRMMSPRRADPQDVPSNLWSPRGEISESVGSKDIPKENENPDRPVRSGSMERGGVGLSFHPETRVLYPINTAQANTRLSPNCSILPGSVFPPSGLRKKDADVSSSMQRSKVEPSNNMENTINVKEIKTTCDVSIQTGIVGLLLAPNNNQLMHARN